jgi:hypothetical protein
MKSGWVVVPGKWPRREETQMVTVRSTASLSSEVDTLLDPASKNGDGAD